MKQTIYGYDYFLDQDFTADDKKSLLKNADSDILFEYELPAGMTSTEAIYELFLRHLNLFHLKPSDVSSQKFVEQLEIIWIIGEGVGKTKIAEFWANETKDFLVQVRSGVARPDIPDGF